MATATLSRSGTSVTLPLLEEGAGAPVAAVDVGKPNAGANSKGTLDPRWKDHWSQLRTYTLRGRLTASNAYDTAITLADLLKSGGAGNPLELSVGLPEYPRSVDVAPAPQQDQALSLAYDPGNTDWVDVQLTLVRVGVTVGTGDQQASTPTAVGSGPIELSDGTDTVAFTRDVSVERTIGRPNSVVRQRPAAHPLFQDKRRRAYDAFELEAEFGDPSTAATLRDMVAQRLGTDSLTLDFNGLYGLGSMAVVPEGSQALRLVRPSAEQGTVVVPTLTLRRVFDP